MKNLAVRLAIIRDRLSSLVTRFNETNLNVELNLSIFVQIIRWPIKSQTTCRVIDRSLSTFNVSVQLELKEHNRKNKVNDLSPKHGDWDLILSSMAKIVTR